MEFVLIVLSALGIAALIVLPGSQWPHSIILGIVQAWGMIMLIDKKNGTRIDKVKGIGIYAVYLVVVASIITITYR